MKIALFSSTLDVKNGYGNITYELCKALHTKGVEFELFLPETEKGKYELEIPFQVNYILPPYIFTVRTPKVLRYFTQNIDLSQFSLVHCLFEFPYSFMAARLAKKYKLPFIMGAQGTYGVAPLTHFPEKYMLLYSYNRAEEIMVPSAFTQSKIWEYSGKKYPVTIIHNGVNYTRFNQVVDTSSLRNQYPGKKILLTVGPPKKRKGQDIIIRALPKVVETHPDVVYLLVGGDPTDKREDFAQLARELGVDKNVVFVGKVSDSEIVKYFHACDVYVHTPRVSNLNFEGFGIVYIEAGACGKASVATDAGGIRDAVVDGETGFVAPDEDSESVANYIIRLLSDEKLREKMGEAGRLYAERHQWSYISEQFIERYRKYSH